MEIYLSELKELIGEKSVNPMADMVGKSVFIRTVTYHYTGKVVKIIGDFVELEKAAWIADSGRFTDALATEEFSEVEVYKNPIRVNTTSIVDFTEIEKGPVSQK